MSSLLLWNGFCWETVTYIITTYIGRGNRPTLREIDFNPNSLLFLPYSWFSGKGLFLKGTRNYHCWDPLITSMIMGGRIVGNTKKSEQASSSKRFKNFGI